jgi:hypothetical protein
MPFECDAFVRWNVGIDFEWRASMSKSGTALLSLPIRKPLRHHAKCLIPIFRRYGK